MISFDVACRCNLLSIMDHHISYILVGLVWWGLGSIVLLFLSWNFMKILYASYMYLLILVYFRIIYELHNDFTHPLFLVENAWSEDLYQLVALGYHIQILLGSRTNRITFKDQFSFIVLVTITVDFTGLGYYFYYAL